MTFFQDLVLHLTLISTPIRWIHNDSMYGRVGGIRNTKTWSKSRSGLEFEKAK